MPGERRRCAPSCSRSLATSCSPPVLPHGCRFGPWRSRAGPRASVSGASATMFRDCVTEAPRRSRRRGSLRPATRWRCWMPRTCSGPCPPGRRRRCARHAETDRAALGAFKRGVRRRARADRGRLPRGEANRGLVPGRGALRPERSHGPPLVLTRDAPEDGQGPALTVGLHLRRRLHCARHRRRARADPRLYRGDEPGD